METDKALLDRAREAKRPLLIELNKSSFGNWPTIRISAEPAFELCNVIDALTVQLAAVTAENTAMLNAVRGDCDYCKHHGGDLFSAPCGHCCHFAAEEFITGDYWEYGPQGAGEGGK